MRNTSFYMLKQRRRSVISAFIFSFKGSTFPILCKLLAFFCDCTGQFVSDLVKNEEKNCLDVVELALDIRM